MNSEISKRIIVFVATVSIILFCLMIFADASTSENKTEHIGGSGIDYKNNVVEYHSFITGETILVNESNEEEILRRIEMDRGYEDAETCVISHQARTRVHELFFFDRASNLASYSYTVTNVNTISQSPYSGVCQILAVYEDSDHNQVISFGSGCFISENAILTAAHCLLDSTYGFPKAIRIYYCFELTPQGGDPFGNLAFCSATSITICNTYYTNDDTMYDYGVINVASNAGSNTGVFKLANMTPTTSMDLTAIGYPEATSSDGYGLNGNLILSAPNPMKVCVGKLDKIASNYLRGKLSSIPCEEGMSGGALIKLNASNYYELLGIMSRKRKILFVDYVYFCRIESNVKTFCGSYGGTNNVSSSLYLMG